MGIVATDGESAAWWGREDGEEFARADARQQPLIELVIQQVVVGVATAADVVVDHFSLQAELTQIRAETVRALVGSGVKDENSVGTTGRATPATGGKVVGFFDRGCE